MPSPAAALRWCERNILLPVTVCFILGISAGRTQLLPEQAAVIALALLAIAALILHRRQPRAALLLCLPIFFLTGHVHLLHHLAKPHAAGQLAALLTEEERRVTLVGTLASMIEESEQDGEFISRFELEAEEVLLDTTWQAVRGRVRLAMLGRAEKLRPGLTLMILAEVGPPEGFSTPGVFDYQGYLAAEGIAVSGWVRGQEDVLVLSGQPDSLRWLPEQLRQQVSLFLRQRLSPELSGLYQALLIGSRAGLTQEIQEQFKAVGTMHLLAISGLHVGLLGLMAGLLLNWLLRRSEWLLLRVHVPTLALLGILPLLLAYGFLAGLNTPVLRAIVMAAALIGAVLLRRRHDMLHLLAAAALFVLACNPLALFTASFQLSFSAVAALILFLPQILLSPESGNKQPKCKRVTTRFLLPALLASVAATLGTLPFMLLHFHRFSLIGPLMNLLIEPLLCLWALPWGLAAIPCISVWPEAAALLLKIGGIGITAALRCTAAASALPWASVWTVSPTAAEMFLYALLLLLWGFKFRKTAITGAVLLTLHFMWGLWFSPQPGVSKTAFLDVGQGSSAFLQLPDGSRILADAGSSGRRNIGEQVIAPYLWSQRIWRLDQAVISHPHRDHFSGMDFIIRHFRPKILWINGDAHREENYQQILEQAEEQGVQVLIPQSGQRIAQGKNFELTVLRGSPPGEDVNEASLALRYRHGRRAFLLPGDIGKQSEATLLRQGTELKADVLLAAHHGSRTSCGENFLTEVRPELIVVSAGRSARQEHFPAAVNLALWQERKIPVLITRKQGTVSCVTDGEGLECGND